MENASKALLIAGGILIAILVLAVVVTVSTSTSKLAQSQDEKKLAEQTAEFNRSFEAYDKKVMYGTDIISVVNKAIDYNKKLKTDQEVYFIDIIFTITDNCTSTRKVVIEKGSGEIEEQPEQPISGESLVADTYQLKTGTGRGTGVNQTLVNFFNQSVNDTVDTETTYNQIKKIYTYSALSNFKKLIFKCTKVDYSEQTGRVNLMVFEQTGNNT